VKPDLDTATFRTPPAIPLGRRGSTLIEVLTAVAIFSIVLTAAFATFTFQKQSYTTQTHVAEMQQNMRVAIDTLLRDIRMGGYGVDSDINVPLSVVGGGSGTIVMRGFQGVDGDNTAADGIYILYAYDMDNTVVDLTNTLTTGAITADNNGMTVGVTAGTGTRFRSGDAVLLNNGTTADLYAVTGSGSNFVTFDAVEALNASGHVGNFYDIGSKVSRARFVRYWIDTTDPAHPTLMVTRLPGAVSQPVADDIEDLQFVYGVASAGSHLVSSTYNVPTTDDQRRFIRRINLSLVARTGVYEKGWQGQRTNLGNRVGTPPTDQYRRRILDNMAIDIRNIRLN
jgi:prepilin-type N-terminal cleavage/methylation domain-containing protein